LIDHTLACVAVEMRQQCFVFYCIYLWSFVFASLS